MKYPRNVWGIFDLDGTLSDSRWRAHLAREKKWDEFHAGIPKDEVRLGVYLLLRGWAELPGKRVALMTGRPERYRAETEEWLALHGIPYDELHMRPEGDFSHASTYKIDTYHEKFKHRDVAFIIDDHPRVIEAFEKNTDIQTLQSDGYYR